jgi:hypothetical protein
VGGLTGQTPVALDTKARMLQIHSVVSSATWDLWKTINFERIDTEIDTIQVGGCHGVASVMFGLLWPDIGCVDHVVCLEYFEVRIPWMIS